MSGRGLSSMLVGGLIVVSCGGDSSGTAPDEPATSSAFHEVPADSVGVTGTAECHFGRPDTGTGDADTTADTTADADENADDFVTCELTMSDPRVSGTETHDHFRYDDIGDDAMVWVVEDALITNDAGTWRGVVQAADDGTPIGEAHYVGEGAYAGLEFHYYFAHVDIAADAQLRGWISGGGQ